MATSTIRSPEASIRPAATASRTAWPMPSWPGAPRHRLELGCRRRGLVHHQRRRPDRLVLGLRLADAAEHRRVPRRGMGEHRDRGSGRRAAAVCEHDVDVAAVRARGRPSPRRSVRRAPRWWSCCSFRNGFECHCVSRTTRVASPASISSNAWFTSRSGSLCEIRRSSGRRPERYTFSVVPKSCSGRAEP